MKIEIWSDVICPFCYIGKRNFETALKDFDKKEELEIIWKSFQLDPQMSDKPLESYVDYLVKNKGMSKEQVETMIENVTNSAKQVGLDYNFDQSILVNTAKAHQLIQFAKTKGLDDAIEEKLFSAFFTEGKNIADTETLIELGNSIGLEKQAIESALNDEQYKNLMDKDIQEARAIGVTGVPFFVFNRKYAVSGAQPPQAFLETLKKSFGEWRAENPKINLEISQGESCGIDGKCD